MAEAVADQLRASIISGDLPPGARLLQEELADRLDVSRAPVRQALVILEREGLVQADRWRGSIVAPLDVLQIKDLYEFRGAVERFVAETLARRGDFDAAPLRALIEQGEGAAVTGDVTRLIDLDLRFHTRLYVALNNRVLSDVMISHWTHTRRVMAATLKVHGYPKTAWDEHAAIIDAIEAHDSKLAGQRAAAHIAAASARMVETFAREMQRLQVTSDAQAPTGRATRPVARGRRR